MTDLENVFYRMMPEGLPQHRKEEGARIMAKNAEKEVQKQSVITGLTPDLLREALIQTMNMHHRPKKELH